MSLIEEITSAASMSSDLASSMPVPILSFYMIAALPASSSMNLAASLTILKASGLSSAIDIKDNKPL
jgi:hypothetical protein